MSLPNPDRPFRTRISTDSFELLVKDNQNQQGYRYCNQFVQKPDGKVMFSRHHFDLNGNRKGSIATVPDKAHQYTVLRVRKLEPTSK